MEKRSLGLPMRCPKCPSRRYFGMLKGENIPTKLVKFTQADKCPNCKTALEPTIQR
jgi:predicted Zn-ribbon and HTH transcriptional regulator